MSTRGNIILFAIAATLYLVACLYTINEWVQS
jgi:hypothetical protein